jgi:hypothetical protein
MPVSRHPAEERGVPAVHELGEGRGGALLTLIHGGVGTADDLVQLLQRWQIDVAVERRDR